MLRSLRDSTAIPLFVLLVLLHCVFGEQSTSEKPIPAKCDDITIPATTAPITNDGNFKYTPDIEFDYFSHNGACLINITCSGYSAVEIIAIGMDGRTRMYAGEIAETTTKEVVVSTTLEWLQYGWGAATSQLAPKDNRFYCMAIVPGSTTAAPPTTRLDPCANVQPGRTAPISDESPFTYSPDLIFSYSTKKEECVMHLSCTGLDAVEIITFLQNGVNATLNDSVADSPTATATATAELTWQEYGWGAITPDQAVLGNLFYCMVIGSNSQLSTHSTTTTQTTSEVTTRMTTSSKMMTSTSTLAGVTTSTPTSDFTSLPSTTLNTQQTTPHSSSTTALSTTEKTPTSESHLSSRFSTPFTSTSIKPKTTLHNKVNNNTHLPRKTVATQQPSPTSSESRSTFSTTEKIPTPESEPSSRYSTPGESGLVTSTSTQSTSTHDNNSDNHRRTITILEIVIGVLIILLFLSIAVILYCWKWRSTRAGQFQPRTSTV